VFFPGNQAHAAFFRDAAGCSVGGCLGGPQHWELEDVKPEVGNGFAGLGHEALSVPGQSKPESTIDVFSFQQGHAPNQPVWLSLEPEGPMPLIAASHGWKSCIAIVGVDAVRRIGPGNSFREIANDLPMRKQKLRLGGVGELQWLQEEARGLKMRDQGLKMITQMQRVSSDALRATRITRVVPCCRA
jgi:hypothetical protein